MAKDRPILFSAPMIRAILDGRKTQTRRVLDAWCDEPPAFVEGGVVTAFDENDRPYRWPRTNAVGDRLWVREAHALLPRTAYRGSIGTGTIQQVEHPTDGYTAAVFREGFDRSGRPLWRPSIHMPRWASRLTLIVTGVKIQRLQDISEEDAIAEGIEPFTDFQPQGHWRRYCDGSGLGYVDSPIASFASLWTEINGPGSWEANPWVVAYSYRAISKNIDLIAEAA